MAKALFYRLFKIGRIPTPVMAQLQAEELVLWDEGLKGSVTYLNFRAPGKYSGWRRVWFIASIALTRTRLRALSYGSPVIDVPLADERLRSMRYTQENADTLCIAFDANLFHPDWSGTIEYRFRTPQVQAFLDLLPRP